MHVSPPRFHNSMHSFPLNRFMAVSLVFTALRREPELVTPTKPTPYEFSSIWFRLSSWFNTVSKSVDVACWVNHPASVAR